jgi:hypothetical protein
MLGLGMASAWGTEEPRLGEVSRLGFWVRLDGVVGCGCWGVNVLRV